ncbi:hypothetical protein RUM43_003182 [Polyplax serrata]|uniref:Uncharacterized protein n=1 Tax=Polyplax serrata TaxID=468196 RepID=A0AAN8P307_POLSC
MSDAYTPLQNSLSDIPFGVFLACYCEPQKAEKIEMIKRLRKQVVWLLVGISSGILKNEQHKSGYFAKGTLLNWVVRPTPGHCLMDIIPQDPD